MGFELSTARLHLRGAADTAAADVAAYYRDNAAHLAPWSPPRPPGFETEAFWAERLAAQARDAAAQTSLHLYVHERDALVGTIAFTGVQRGPFMACNLGFSVAAVREGRGVMREALEVAVPAALERLDLHRVQANHLPENVRSAALLRRLGFAVEGYARDYLWIGGRWRDHVLTSFTRAAAAPTPR